MNNPEYIKLNDEKIKLNTDYRIALKCQEVAEDTEISDTERALAIEYLLIGEKCFEIENHDKLIELLLKYLSMGEEVRNEKPDMNFSQDEDLIYASFMSDYNIDINSIDKMHWWTFLRLLRGLTDNCVLNRVRDIRNMDISDYDNKTQDKLRKAKEQFALKKKVILNDNAKRFFEQMGIERK